MVVGNGTSIQCVGCWKVVSVTKSDQVFYIFFYVLTIHGVGIIFRVQWLQNLGPFLSDYSVPSIQFSYNNKPITLIGMQLLGFYFTSDSTYRLSVTQSWCSNWTIIQVVSQRNKGGISSDYLTKNLVFVIVTK